MPHDSISTAAFTTAALLACALWGGQAGAATINWAGGAAGNWDTTATNWSGGAGWDVGTTDTANFATAGAAVTVTAPVYAGGITFTQAAILGGTGTITLTGAAPTVAATSSGTINAGLVLSAGGAATINAAGGTTLALGGGITRNVGSAAIFGTTGTTTTSSGMTNGILGTWAFVGSSGTSVNYATVSGGAITANTTFTSTGTNFNDSAINYRASSTGTAISGATANTLFSGTPGLTTALTDTLTVNGLLSVNNGWVIGVVATPGTLIIGADKELVVNTNNNPTTIHSAIADNATLGASALTKVNTGTLTLNGTSTYSGTTTILGGTLAIATNTVNSGLTGTIGLGDVIIGGGAQLSFRRNDTYIVGNSISGAGTLNQASSNTAGILVLTGNNSYGVTNFNNAGSTLQIGNGGTTGTLGTGAVTFNALTATLAFNRSDTHAVSNAISGSGNLKQIGTGTTILSGGAVNTFTGGLTVNAGTLALDFANLATPTNLVGSGNALALGGGALSIKGKAGAVATSQTLGAVTVNSGGGSILIDANGGTSTTLRLGALTATAAGSALLVGTTAGTGAVTTTTNKDARGIYGGRMVFTNGSAAGYDFVTTASVSSPFTLSAYAGYAAMNAGAAADTLNSRVVGSLTLTGAHTHNTLKIESPGASQTLDLGANLLTLTGGGLLATGTNAYTLAGTAATGITAGNGSGAYDLVVHQYNSGGLVISAAIGNNGANAVSLTKAGTGTLTLSGANTYTGKTYLNAGALSIGVDNNLGAAPGAAVADQLSFNGGTLQFSASATLAANRGITLNAAGGTIDTNSFNAAYSGNIAGSGPLAKIGAGTLSLSGVNTYAGATDIQNGALQLTSALAAATTLNLGNGANSGKLILGNASALNQTVADLTTSGTGTANAVAGGNAAVSTLTVNKASGTSLFAGTLGGAGSNENSLALTKSGTGTLVLSGANSYTGATTVSAGILSLQNNAALGSTASGTSVASGATLELGGGLSIGAEALTLNGIGAGGIGALHSTGNNTYGGAITIATNATLGNGGGTLILTGGIDKTGTTVTFNGGGTTKINGPLGLHAPDGVPNSDVIVGPGTVEINAPSSYDGSTTIQNTGKLLVNSTLLADGTVFVNSGGVLGGTGGTLTINGTLQADAGSIITGGDLGTLGTLTIAGTGTRKINGAYQFDVDYDTMTADDLVITNATSLDLTGAIFAINEINGSMPVAGTNYAIKIFESNIADPSHTPAFTPSATGLARGQSIVTWDGGKTYYLVPEPASFALLGLGGLLLLRRPARRRGRMA